MARNSKNGLYRLSSKDLDRERTYFVALDIPEGLRSVFRKRRFKQTMGTPRRGGAPYRWSGRQKKGRPGEAIH